MNISADGAPPNHHRLRPVAHRPDDAASCHALHAGVHRASLPS